MPGNVREITEQREHLYLSSFAAKADESEGRPVAEGADPVRTVYQRDRDRILHSKPFRRLKHKTQVFIDPRGDHYRTRLTHTLEVAQVARTIGRALRLNEDLIEAIALGHDVGHTPFGHAGERALDEAVKELARPGEPQGFSHSEQSLRIVDVLEKLNLTEEVRLGIGGHSKGRNDLSAHDGEAVSTLEAAVVRISDRVAYMNHDLDDAIRSGIISAGPDWAESLGSKHGERVETMVLDIIENSLDRPAIQMSANLLRIMNDLKEWLFEHVYLEYPVRYPDIPKAENMVKELYRHFRQPNTLPEKFEGAQGAIDYIAGMTDRYAIEAYTSIKVPSTWRVS